MANTLMSKLAYKDQRGNSGLPLSQRRSDDTYLKTLRRDGNTPARTFAKKLFHGSSFQILFGPILQPDEKAHFAKMSKNQVKKVTYPTMPPSSVKILRKLVPRVEVYVVFMSVE